MPNNIRFATIPNGVVPLDTQITNDVPGFFQATLTNLDVPFEKILDQLEPPVTAIIGDVELKFLVANSLTRNRRLTVDLLDSDYEEHINGISSAQLADLQAVLHGNDLSFMQLELECISTVSKADCLIVKN
ncbi:hypothetical protein RIF29_02065 [Crotalaria pallida]|uniref:Uncharacterized protein n=1 Tax=Crotalaria pallida TaxID=3830 RepID=A0AAN9IYT0_CROPI